MDRGGLGKKGQKRDRRSADSGLGAEEEDSPARRVRQRPSEGVVVPPRVEEEPEPPEEQESEDDRVARLIGAYRVQEGYTSDEDRQQERPRRPPRAPPVQVNPRQALLDPDELREKLEELVIPEGQEAAAGQGVADVTFASASSSSSSEASVVGVMAFNMADFMAGIGGAIGDAAREGARAVIAAQVAPPPHAGGAQLNAIPVFNPDEKTVGALTAKEWIRRVERLGNNFNWGQELLAGAAKNKLGGSAATWLEGQLVRGVNMATWPGDNGFRAQFLLRFDKARGALAAVEAISDLTQKSGQSVRAFYDAVAIAVDLKHFNIAEADKQEPNYITMRDNDIYILFQAGISRRIKELAMAGADPPANAQALLDAAVRVEITLHDHKTHKVGEVKEGPKGGEAGSSDEDEANRTPEEQIAALKRQLKKATSKERGQMKCFEKDCQSTEHMVANCPIRKAKIQARNRGRGGSQGGRGGPWQNQNRGGWNGGGGGGGGWNRYWSPSPSRGYGYPPRRPRTFARGFGGGGRGRGQPNYTYEIQEEHENYDYQGQEPYEHMTEEMAAHGYEEYGDGNGDAMYSGNA